MITKADDFFAKGCGRCARFETPDCSAMTWGAGVAALRAVCLDMGLLETVKWGHPCYLHADRNIALIGAFRSDFRLTFMNAGLLGDTHGALVANGPNTATPSVMTFTSVAEVAAKDDTIRHYLAALKNFAERGIKPPKIVREITLPDELVDVLDQDPELSEAFAALTPGRQRSYVLSINSAKQTATRLNRIAKSRDKIIAGKGATER